jgi:hypothetical protein
MNQEDPGRSVGQAKQKTAGIGMMFEWKETETMLPLSCGFEGATETKNAVRNTAAR